MGDYLNALREAAEMLEKSEVVNETPADNGMGFWTACGRFGKPLEAGEHTVLWMSKGSKDKPGDEQLPGQIKMEV